MKKVLITAIICLGFLSAYAGTYTRGKWELTTTNSSGEITISSNLTGTKIVVINKSKTAFRNGTATATLSTMNAISSDTSVPWTDEFGTGIKVTIVGTATAGGAANVRITQDFFLYDDLDYFLTEFIIESTNGSTINCNYMAPIYWSTTGNTTVLSNTSNNRTLEFPPHNDSFIRTWISAFGTSNITSTNAYSFEVGAAFHESTYRGLIAGSLEHNVWKTGVDIITRNNNNIYSLMVYGGKAPTLAKNNTSLKLTDTQNHGFVRTNPIKSPKMFIGYFNDWRDGMETYAAANEKLAPKKEYYGRKPFGWNSWGHIKNSLNYTNATESADWLKNNVQHTFNNDNTLYIGLDSYWDNMHTLEVVNFPNYVAKNGQKAGIYGGAYVHWSTDGNQDAGGGYIYDNLYLKYNGSPQRYDEARALDPTHPRVKEFVENQINNALWMGYRYIKLDFLAHAWLETGTSTYYDTNITTGAQAYNYALNHINNYIKNHPLYPKDDDFYVNLSIAPAFPANMANSRRISCDAWGTVNDIRYMLNTLQGGWWLDRAGYWYNDADHIASVEGNDNRTIQTEALNRARVTSSVITGIFISGDNFSNETIGNNNLSTVKSRMSSLLTNAAVNELARHCKSFRPVTTVATGTANACPVTELFTTKIGDITYLAVFPFATGAKSVPVNGLGLSTGTYVIEELWSGTTVGSSVTLTAGGNWTSPNLSTANDPKIYKIYPTGTTGQLPPLPVINRPAPQPDPPVVIPPPTSPTNTAVAGGAPGPNWEIIQTDQLIGGYHERGRIIWGDYNNDGHLDAFKTYTKSNGRSFALFQNNGDGSFTNMTATLPLEMSVLTMQSGNASTATFLDYNNDGNLDLIVMGKLGGIVNDASTIVYKNSGPPDYKFVKDKENTGIIRGGLASNDNQGKIIQAVDFDHDGWVDLVLTGSTGGGQLGWRMTHYYKNVQGVFQRQTNLVSGNDFEQFSGGALNVGDVNGDGFADFVVFGYSQSLGHKTRLYINNGNGTFTNSPYSDNMGSYWCENSETVFADLTGNGLDDIIEVNNNYANIYINNGNGTAFTKYEHPSGMTNKDATAISVGDVNNDGKLDFLVSGMGDPNTSFFYNVDGGTASFTKVDLPEALRARSGGTCLVDINGDGSLDLSVFGWRDGNGGWPAAFALNTLGNGVNANAAPTIPDNFNISYSGGKYHLTWSRSTDDKTSQAAIRYNVYARNYDDGMIYAYAPAHEATGKLKVQDGLVHLLATNSYDWALPQTNTFYTFGVSAVDQSNMASAFNLVEFPEVPTIVWTGTTDTDWEKRTNWTPEIIPDAKRNVLIPAGKTNYPILKGDESVKTLFMAKGAKIELSDYTLSAIEGITAQGTATSNKWYSIGFPFDVETVYSVEYDCDLTPWSHFWLKEYNSSTHLFDPTNYINALEGCILQLPKGYPANTEIHYISGPVNALAKGELFYQNDTYILQANPTLAPITIDGTTLAAANLYIYKLDTSVDPDYLLIEGNATIAPFEAIATFKKVTMAPAPRISMGENAQTDIDDKIVAPDVILSKTLYNMQGQAIEKPQKGSVYIEQTIFQSGRTKVVKQIK